MGLKISFFFAVADMNFREIFKMMKRIAIIQILTIVLVFDTLDSTLKNPDRMVAVMWVNVYISHVIVNYDLIFKNWQIEDRFF